MTNEPPTSGGGALLELFGPLIGLAVVVIGSVATSRMAAGAGIPPSAESTFEFIAGFALLALFVFGGLFAVGLFYWLCWEIVGEVI